MRTDVYLAFNSNIHSTQILGDKEIEVALNQQELKFFEKKFVSKNRNWICEELWLWTIFPLVFCDKMWKIEISSLFTTVANKELIYYNETIH